MKSLQPTAADYLLKKALHSTHFWGLQHVKIFLGL